MLAISGYDIGEVIYTSAKSTVYRGFQHANATPVILKYLSTVDLPLAEMAHFTREYGRVKNLQLENFVKLYGLETLHDANRSGFVLVQEDFQGQALSEYINTGVLGASSRIETIIKVFIQLADALEKLHESGVIHKDINPRHIAVESRSGLVKITDFGLASIITHEDEDIYNPSVIKETLPYISPEQSGRINRSVGYSSDIYSLGVTLYEALTGAPPFLSEDPLELIHFHIAREPEPPNTKNPRIPVILSDIVMRLLAKTMDDRYKTARGLRVDLEKCLAGLSPSDEIPGFTLGESDVVDHIQISGKLYGREAESEALLSYCERVCRKGAPELVMVHGEAGIGKSALVYELNKFVLGERGYFISAKYDQERRVVPRTVIIRAFEGLVKQLLTEPDERLAMWREKILDALGANAGLILDLIPELKLIIGRDTAPREIRGEESRNLFNYTFRKFVQVFTDENRPLALFLDDLQWADAASLRFIKVLLSEPHSHSLLVIGSYRDESINETHPLKKVIEEFKEEGVLINEIHLRPLPQSQISQILSDTLSRPLEQTRELADYIYKHTGGNPLFTRQFILSLYDEGLLYLDPKIGWRWKLGTLLQHQENDTVFDLLSEKISKLSPESRDILACAACIGFNFRLEVLATVIGKNLEDTYTALFETIQNGFIVKTADDYSFSHDRVLEAAFTLLTEEQKKEVRFKIGRMLLEEGEERGRSDAIFDLAGHLNAGDAMSLTDEEKIILVRLNLKAAIKAKILMAYVAALQFLRNGMDCLNESSWQNQYELTYEIYRERAEVEFLNGNISESQEIINQTLEQTRTLEEKTDLFNLLIIQHTMNFDYERALERGAQALEFSGYSITGERSMGPLSRLFWTMYRTLNFRLRLPGSTFSDRKVHLAILQEFALVQRNLKKVPGGKIAKIPKLEDPRAKTILRLFTNISVAAFLARERGIFSISSLRSVNYSLSRGNTPDSVAGYVFYGVLLGSFQGDYKNGYKYGKMALELSEELGDLGQKCLASFIFANTLSIWVRNLAESTRLNQEGFRAGLESGNFQFAGYILIYKIVNPFVAGENIERILREVPEYLYFCQETNNRLAADVIIACRGILYNLSGQTDARLSFSSEDQSEENLLNLSRKTRNFTALCYYFIFQIQIFYIYGEYEKALGASVQAEELSDVMVSFLPSVEFVFYSALTLIRIVERPGNSHQREYINKITKYIKMLEYWASRCPENFECKYLLVKAEQARVMGETEEALEIYDRARDLANRNSSVQVEALAAELTAQYWLEREKPEIGKYYLEKAYICYGNWGAYYKVQEFEAKYPDILKDEIGKPGLPTEAKTGRKGVILDLNTLMKASQALSSEIVWEDLLKKLIDIAIENAAAQKGYLLLNREGKLYVRARGDTESGAVYFNRGLPLEHSDEMSASVIYYVKRTQETIVLNNAGHSGGFTTDPYIAKHKTRSILCMPIVHQSKLIGILYLENNLSEGSFNFERRNTLELLSSQIAISLENAGYYEELKKLNTNLKREIEERKRVEREIQRLNADLERRVRERTAKLEETNQELEAFSYTVSHDLRAPLRRIDGFGQMLKQDLGDEMGEREKGHIERIHTHIGQMASLIDNLLELSRVKKAELKLENVNLSEIAEEIIADLRDTQPDPVRKVETRIEKDIIVENVDSVLIRNVLQNLLNNAWKFTRDCPEALIEFGRRRNENSKETSRYYVRDNGVGFDMKEVEKLFNVFQRLNHEQRFEGNGIGLASVGKIISRHDGNIWAEGTPGKGATFYFTLGDVKSDNSGDRKSDNAKK